MNAADILLEAYRRGRAWGNDPEFANLRNLDEASVRKMTGAEADAKLLIRSLQLSDANYDVLVLEHHRRAPQFDGEVGPATLGLLNIPRCPLPDFPPPLGARFHYDDPDLQSAVESMQRAAAEPPIKGPYWRGCDPQRPDVHSLVIGIDARNAPPNWRMHQEKILEHRRACAAEIGVAVRFVVNPPSMDGLQQWQVFRGLPGSTIGLNYFPSSGSCGRIPSGSLDTGYDPSDWRLHANLGTHESEGHGFGFNHTRGGIMNPSIVLVWPLSWRNDPGWSQVTDYYPGKPLDSIPQPPPPQPPGPPSNPVLATFALAGVSYEIRKAGGTVPGPNPFPA